MEAAPTVVVYSKTPCVQCGAVKRKLDKEGVDYTVDDLTPLDTDTDEQKAEKQRKVAALGELGYTGVPVVFINDDHHYGYQPDKIVDAAARQRRALLHVVPDAA